MNKQYDLVSTINGYTATHVRDGIYKVETPFRINIDEWTHDEASRNYSVLGTNYSSDYRNCEIHYFTRESYGEIVNFMHKLNSKDADKYGYIMSMYYDSLEPLGGIIVGI